MRSWNLPIVAIAPCLAVAGLISVACSSQTTTRTVDDPTGVAVEYGQPQDTSYVAQLEANRQRARITIYEQSRCAVIPVTVMQQYRETLRGGEVVSSEPLNKRQVAGEAEKEISCKQTYARNVEVLLEIDGARINLGLTNPEGMVGTDLAKVLQLGAYEDELPPNATVLIRPDKARALKQAGTISLTQLSRQQERLTELVAELEGILDKGVSTEDGGATQQDIRRSYEIYAQLHEIAPSDPRVEGLSARFWELFLDRKQAEARQRMEKNLDALGRAKETLKVMGDAAIPLYVQAAVNSGYLDRRALEWSSLRLVRALRGAPAVCSAGFAFGAVPSYGWAPDAELAAHYVQYAYGSNHAQALQAACQY